MSEGWLCAEAHERGLTFPFPFGRRTGGVDPSSISMPTYQTLHYWHGGGADSRLNSGMGSTFHGPPQGGVSVAKQPAPPLI